MFCGSYDALRGGYPHKVPIIGLGLVVVVEVLKWNNIIWYVGTGDIHQTATIDLSVLTLLTDGPLSHVFSLQYRLLKPRYTEWGMDLLKPYRDMFGDFR